MNHLVHFVALAAAGAVGTLLRAGCTTAAVKIFGPSFPWGTLAANVIGSFAFGAITALTRGRGITPEQETVLLVGLLGGFTSYSSFAFQSVALLESGRAAAALAYMAFTNVAGLVAVWAGLRLCR
jgi:CrcB protein